MTQRTVKLCILMSATILVLVAVLLVVCSGLLALRVPIAWYDLPLAVALAMGFAWWGAAEYFPQERRWAFGWAVGGSVGALVIFALLCGLIYDTSWDGQTYHAEAILRLAAGWDPFYELPPRGVVFGTYLHFFSKGPWLASAALYTFTGQFEQAKAFHLLLILAALLLALAALAQFRALNRRWRWIFALLLAFNPVSVCQMFTFYVDGQLSSCLVMLVCLLLLIYRRWDRVLCVGLAALLIILLNVKLTGAVYAGLICGGFGLWYGMTRRVRRVELAVWVMVGGLMGGSLVGFNPYLTQYAQNLIAEHDPLYPTDWQALIAIDYNSPGNFIGMNRWEKLFTSLFSQSEGATQQSHWKIPLAVFPSEVAIFFAPDVRIAGFGPLFGGAVLITLAVMVGLWRQCGWRMRHFAVVWVLVLLLLVSALSNSEVWWARYAPQLGLLPVLVALVGIYGARHGRLRLLNQALCGVLCLNCLLVSVPYVISAGTMSLVAAHDLAYLRDHADAAHPYPVNFNSFVGLRFRFEQEGIPYVEVAALPCSPDEQLVLTGSIARVCIGD